MGKKQRYTSEYKLQALELCKQPGRTMESIAQELGVPYKTLVGWKKRYSTKGTAAFPGHGRVVLTEEQRRIQELEKENAILRQEREILKKATLFFAKESK